MAITLPVYTNCLRQDVGDPGGTAEFPAGGSGAIKIRVHGAAVAEAASPGIARGLTTIIDLGMNDHAAPDNRIEKTSHRDVLRDDGVARGALGIGLEVTEISSVALVLRRQTVIMAVRGVMPPGALAIVEPDITILVDMNRVLTVRVESRDVGLDLDAILRLGKHNGSCRLIARGRLHARHDLGNALPLRAVLMMASMMGQVAGNAGTDKRQENEMATED